MSSTSILTQTTVFLQQHLDKLTRGGFGAKHIASHFVIDPVSTHVPVCCRQKSDLKAQHSQQHARSTAQQTAVK